MYVIQFVSAVGSRGLMLRGCALAVLISLCWVPSAIGQFVEQPPEDSTEVQTFRLLHARAETVANLLDQVYAERLRLAVDERSNTLIVLSEPIVSGPIEQLVGTLDSAPVAASQGEQLEERTLQLRILWLMDGLPDDVGVAPDERYVSPMIVDTLHGLGLERPKIVCQHVTTLSAQHEHVSNFRFNDPVKIGEVWADLAGTGQLSIVAGSRCHVDLHMKIEDQRRGTSEMGGSLVMPLEHYVVLGTSNYVDYGDETDEEEVGRSLPTAFVVFLQEATIAPR